MIKRFTGQEVFIILAALLVLLFMYLTIILSASSYEAIDLYSEVEQSMVFGEFESVYDHTFDESRVFALNIYDVRKNYE